MGRYVDAQSVLINGSKANVHIQVLPDNDYECLSVLQEHGQDIKAVLWHPIDEVIRVVVYMFAWYR